MFVLQLYLRFGDVVACFGPLLAKICFTNIRGWQLDPRSPKIVNKPRRQCDYMVFLFIKHDRSPPPRPLNGSPQAQMRRAALAVMVQFSPLVAQAPALPASDVSASGSGSDGTSGGAGGGTSGGGEGEGLAGLLGVDTGVDGAEGEGAPSGFWPQLRACLVSTWWCHVLISCEVATVATRSRRATYTRRIGRYASVIPLPSRPGASCLTCRRPAARPAK